MQKNNKISCTPSLEGFSGSAFVFVKSNFTISYSPSMVASSKGKTLKLGNVGVLNTGNCSDKRYFKISLCPFL